MKKILIPFFGLLVLILLTPFILGKLANSNIDKKIAKFRSEGIQIQEVHKDISYLTSNREFKITFNDSTKNKNWQEFHKIINNASFDVKLKFKNLPITKADMNILANINFKNFTLNEIKMHLVTKNFKTFKYQVLSIQDFKIENFTGKINKRKYTSIDTVAKTIKYKNIFNSEENKLNGQIKDILLGLVDINWYSKSWKLKYNNIHLNADNSEENITTKLLPNGQYILNDKFISPKFGLKTDKFKLAFENLNCKLKVIKQNSLKDSNITLSLKWDKTEYHKIILDGANVDFKLQILNPTLNNIKDIQVILNIDLQKNLFDSVTKDLNPEMVNKYFKNNKTHIEIKNGEITANGNRIQ